MTRFIKRRTDVQKNVQDNVQLPKPQTHEAIKKIIKAENKTLQKARKKAKLQKIKLSEIHEQLMLYAMRVHLRQVLKDIEKKHFVTEK